MKNNNNNNILIGAHLSYKKDSQILGTIKDAIEIGANSGAFYISNSRSYLKYEQNIKLIKEAKILAEKKCIKLENFIVHAPLVGNIANIDINSKIHEMTIDSYFKDLKAMEKIGIKFFNFHPGSAPNKNLGIKRIANGINELLERTPNDKTILLLETMMKKGNYIGSNFEELSEILNLVQNKDRIGICMDTCHVWDGGYDIKNTLDDVLNEFDKIIGLKYLKALHINDSKNEIGSNKDRHENIGKGYIGLEALQKFVQHPKLKNLPKAIETPYGKDNFKRWKEEIKLLLNN